MKITYDKTVDALYVYINKGKIKKTIKINDYLLVDVTEKGTVVGVEMLFVSSRQSTHIPRKILLGKLSPA